LGRPCLLRLEQIARKRAFCHRRGYSCACLREVGRQGVALLREIEPGIPLTMLLDEAYYGMPVITKGGLSATKIRSAAA